jgi:hypothetical protein
MHAEGDRELILAVGRVAIASAELEAACVICSIGRCVRVTRSSSRTARLWTGSSRTVSDWSTRRCATRVRGKARGRICFPCLLNADGIQLRGAIIHASWGLPGPVGEYAAISGKRHRRLKALAISAEIGAIRRLAQSLMSSRAWRSAFARIRTTASDAGARTRCGPRGIREVPGGRGAFS